MSREFDIQDILEDAGTKRKDLIGILHKVQARFGHVPASALSPIARRLRLTESEIFGVLTFYRAFTLEPRGRTHLAVCLGTACHMRGGAEIAAALERRLGIVPGRAAADHAYSLETVNCLGYCAIGPVVVVNGTSYARMTPKTAEALVLALHPRD